MWVHEILCADKSSKNEQLLIRPLVKNQKYECGGQLKLEFIFRFMETTHKPSHLKQIKFVAVKDHGHTYRRFI
jgi:hypothetical protein